MLELVTELLTITLVTAIFTKVWTRTHLLQLHQITKLKVDMNQLG